MKRYLVSLFVLALSLSGFAHAQCAAFPCVVATISLTNQNTSIPNTPIFTPVTTGIFRISAYLSTTRAHVRGGLWLVQLKWTDDNGTVKDVTVAHERSSNAFIATAVVQDIGGQPLLYATTPQGGAGGSMTYNLFIVVEQLQ